MATKVGGFTKSGVVQCVKLVEEVPSPSVDGFNGVVEGGHIKFNNGYVMTLRETFDSPQEINIPYDKIQSFTFSDTYNVDVFTLVFSGVKVRAFLLSTGKEIWNNGQSTYLNYLKITPIEDIGDLSEYALYIFELFFDSTVGRYQIPERITANTITCNYNGTPPLLPAAAKLSSITVRMGKDGTLKCAKLVEENTIQNFYSASEMSSGVVTLKNGIKISITANGSGYDSFSFYFLNNDTEVIRFYGIQVGSTYTSNKKAEISSEQLYSQTSSLEITSIRVSSVMASMIPAGTVMRCKIEFNNSTYEYSGMSSSSGSSVTCYSSTGNFFIPTKLRNYPVTIYKNGIIKCSKLQEANSWTYKSWENGTLATDGIISLPNGYKFTLKNKNGVIKKFDSYFVFSLESESTTIIELSGSNGNSSVTVNSSSLLLDKQVLIDAVSFNSPSQVLSLKDSFDMTNPKGVTYRLTCMEVEGSTAYFIKGHPLYSLMPIPISDRAAPQWI